MCQCRLNTFAGITPSSSNFADTEEYKKVVDLGHQYIIEYGLSDFSGFLQGDQYYVQLWTAHIIYNYKEVNEKLKAQCIEIIIEYSNHPINQEVALQEQNWLLKNNL